MFFCSQLVAIILAAVASANPRSGNSTRAVSRCGTTISNEKISQCEIDFQARVASRKGTSSLVPSSATIQVYWNIISENDTVEGGAIPTQQISKQMIVLNEDYSSTGLSFVLADINRVTDPNWFAISNPDDPLQTEMKTKFRRGGAADLNLYSTGFTSSSGQGSDVDPLGYSTFPWAYESNPKDDGVVFSFSTVPGGSTTNFNGGRTLTHQVGHWVGLYHTFEGGCPEPGDYVDDTPAEAIPAVGCPIGRNTCSDRPGIDPVQNFMDSSYDSCMNNFTPGQADRIKDQISIYRGL